jgi:hypothetical protein
LANLTEQKTKITAGITTRALMAIEAEAKRRGISFSDQVRRIVDDWMDRHDKPAEREVFVLDRETNQVRRAR